MCICAFIGSPLLLQTTLFRLGDSTTVPSHPENLGCDGRNREDGGKWRKKCKMGGTQGLGGISKKIIGMGEKLVKQRKRVKKIEGTEEEVRKLWKNGKRRTMDAKVEDGGD